jgi:hypothetical protein
MASSVWNRQKPEDMGSAIQALLDGYKKDQGGRVTNYVRNLELYEGRDLGGYSGHAYQSFRWNDDGFENDRLMIIRSMARTGVAEIYGQQKPKPQFQTLGATWSVRRKAKRLDKICEGILNQRQGRWINVWQFMLREAGPECILQGVAPIKVTADLKFKRICHELVPHVRLFTDPAEGRNPQSLFEVAPISQAGALARWPGAEQKQAIEAAKAFDWSGMGAKSSQTNRAVIADASSVMSYPFEYAPSRQRPEPAAGVCLCEGICLSTRAV